MSVKLTKAQQKFLHQLDERRMKLSPGFDLDVLRGPETTMARRLEAGGLVHQPFARGRGAYWDITPAGRAALDQGVE